MSAYAGGFVNVDVKVNETEILRLIAKCGSSGITAPTKQEYYKLEVKNGPPGRRALPSLNIKR